MQEDELKALKRKKLQTMCKARGLKANGKTTALIASLVKAFAEEGSAVPAAPASAPVAAPLAKKKATKASPKKAATARTKRAVAAAEAAPAPFVAPSKAPKKVPSPKNKAPVSSKKRPRPAEPEVAPPAVAAPPQARAPPAAAAAPAAAVAAAPPAAPPAAPAARTTSNVKRPRSPPPASFDAEVKRARTGAVVVHQRVAAQSAVVAHSADDGSMQNGANRPAERTSSLTAPTMLLDGHASPIYTVAFDPSGMHLASGDHSGTVHFWNVHGECANYMMLQKAHKNAVTELHWSSDGASLVTCSADTTVAKWDAAVGKRTRKLEGHSSFVNSCAVASGAAQANMVASGADDGHTKLWDARQKKAVLSLERRFQVTSVALAADALTVYSGGELSFMYRYILRESCSQFDSLPLTSSTGLDGDVAIWDIRKDAVSTTLNGHGNALTGIALNPAGTHLLSNALDRTVKIWDVRLRPSARAAILHSAPRSRALAHRTPPAALSPPRARSPLRSQARNFVAGERCVKTLLGGEFSFIYRYI